MEKISDHMTFQVKQQTLNLNNSTMLCGIVNVTPDSFSDGGKWFGKDEAIKHAKDLINQGCQMIDIGGESTRPGSTYVEIDDEIERILPVIKELKATTDVIISVDTWKSEVAKAAIEAGADIINDITGLLGDAKMAETIAQSDAGVIVMLNPVIARPNHPSAKIFPQFGAEGVFSDDELAAFSEMSVVDMMATYFDKSIAVAQSAHLPKERIMLDPGIGFGLTKRENYTLLKNLSLIHEWGYPCFLGVSRKRFIQNTLVDAGFDTDTETTAGFELRDQASAILTAIAALKGVEVVRVHSVREHYMAKTIADNVRHAEDLADTNFEAYQNK